MLSAHSFSTTQTTETISPQSTVPTTHITFYNPAHNTAYRSHTQDVHHKIPVPHMSPRMRTHTYTHARAHTHTHTQILCTHTLLPAPHPHQGNLRDSNALVLSFSLPASPSPSPPLPASLQAHCPRIQLLSLPAMGDPLAGPLALRPHLPSPHLHTVGNEGRTLGQLLRYHSTGLQASGSWGFQRQGSSSWQLLRSGGPHFPLRDTPSMDRPPLPIPG